jgi:transcriptional regulator with XRE-family HTH domain
MARTKAAAKLAEKCRPGAPEIAQVELAEALGVPRQAVAAWLKGEYKPKLAIMLALEKLTGIPVAEWAEPEEDSTPAKAS